MHFKIKIKRMACETIHIISYVLQIRLLEVLSAKELYTSSYHWSSYNWRRPYIDGVGTIGVIYVHI